MIIKTRIDAMGLILWSIFPEARTTIACLLSATLIFYVFSAAVKLTVGRIVGDQLIEIRCEMNAIAERVEHIASWHSAKPQASETLLE
jgi:hypothetical protein